ncbi:MAG TPA: GGDEF domain-containing protein [Vicinamibacteria bacterium]|nr:GGDEF domain-containing protein [Vicinamibacteria bacterium]
MSERSLQPYYPELARLGVEERLDKGGVLWREGDPGDSVALLLEGTLEIVHEPQDGGEPVVLRTLEGGAVVGELASTDGRARSATVRAVSPCRLLKIPAPDFRNLLRRRPDVLEALYWLQVERVRSLTQQVTRTHQRAITDPLTRLYNFGFFRERLEIEVDRAAQTGDLVSLVIFDIDHFKAYNDNNGHEEGNVALTTVSDIIKSTGRRGDIVARYGGEEFVALLYGATRQEAESFGETVRQTVESTVFAGGPRQPGGGVTISAGVATFPWDAQNDEALIKEADENLYKAKEGGRNRVVASEAAPELAGGFGSTPR